MSYSGRSEETASLQFERFNRFTPRQNVEPRVLRFRPNFWSKFIKYSLVIKWSHCWIPLFTEPMSTFCVQKATSIRKHLNTTAAFNRCTSPHVLAPIWYFVHSEGVYPKWKTMFVMAFGHSTERVGRDALHRIRLFAAGVKTGTTCSLARWQITARRSSFEAAVIHDSVCSSC